MHDMKNEIGTVSGASESSCQFNQVGKISFTVDEQVITLVDVAYVPSFHVNLISVSRATLNGAQIEFLADKGVVTHQSCNLMFTFPKEGDLYVLTPSHIFRSSSPSSSLIPTSHTVSSQL
jgi:hypothetical protein